MNAQKELCGVGEAAGRLQAGPRTIKYTEEIGPVEPESRSQGGFRPYGEREVERLERILRMEGMGLAGGDPPPRREGARP